MRNILLTVSYDGTDFCGWQRQDAPDGGSAFRTVQGELESALEKFHGQSLTLYGSGRTDSGVHALSQAANFFSPLDSIPPQNYVQVLNSMLPPDIRITNSCEVPQEFNSRYSATSRVYRYFISFGKAVSAYNSRFSWFVRNYEPDLERLNAYCACLCGETDCAAFAASGDLSQSTFRYIEGAGFFIQKDAFGMPLLVFEIEANAFLWKMVRTLTGTIVSLDKTAAPSDSLQKILDSRDRTKAGVTAPPSGLFLYKIKFDGIRRHV